jgi:hypothetical protein
MPAKPKARKRSAKNAKAKAYDNKLYREFDPPL